MQAWKKLRWLLLCTLCIMLYSMPVAQAYIDPATTSYIIQIVAAAFITLGVAFSSMTMRARLFFTKLKMKLMAERIRRKAKVTPDAVQAEQAKEPIKRRLLLALLSAFAFSFTFFIYGIYDLIIGNRNVLPFYFREVWWAVLLVGILVFAVLGCIVFLRGRAFTTAVSILLGITLAGYLQGNFLNIDFGQLTGDQIAWEMYTKQALINLFVWALVMTVIFLVRSYSKIIWRITAIVLAVAVIGIQSIALIYSFVTTDALTKTADVRYLSEKEMFEVGTQENVLIFVVDRFDNTYVERILKDTPDFFDRLDGFTQYHNNTSYYARTFPSAVNMLTGYVHKYERPADEFFADAWGNSRFLQDLQQQGYTTKLYMENRYTYTDIQQLEGVAANIDAGERNIAYKTLLPKLMKFSAFRYAPQALKANFWLSTDEFGKSVQVKQSNAPYMTDDARAYQQLQEKGVHLDKTEKNFAYYHFHGCHSPYVIDEYANPVEKGSSSLVQQAKGVFYMIYQYLDELKALGLYEDATIIITGDHGVSTDLYPLNYAVATGLFVKEKGESKWPLAHSYAPVNSDNLRATAIAGAGIQTGDYGLQYSEVKQDADVVRKYYYRINGTRDTKGILEEFDIRGDANDFSNWQKVQEHIVEYPHG